ncbi:MAG: hypothetical protein MUC38_00025 [Cyclobacteriaceae bacterium]|jgi:hypothetical protein|nr:hypothetical protein [Cyclobacteriaceae bacterium]
MSNKTRNILKVVAVLLVLLAVLMATRTVIIPSLAGYSFWMVVIAFAMLLIASK